MTLWIKNEVSQCSVDLHGYSLNVLLTLCSYVMIKGSFGTVQMVAGLCCRIARSLHSNIKCVPKACSQCPLEWARKNRGLEVPKLFRALWASAVQFTSPIHVACSVDIAWGRLALFSLNKLICVNTQKDEAQIWLRNTKKDWNLKHVGLALWRIVKNDLLTARIALWVKG